MKKYKAYIAANEYSNAFDFALSTTKKGAITRVKRQNSPDWRDCFIWCVYVHGNGEEERP